MIDLGKMKVPIIEDEKGKPTWSLLVGDVSVSDAEVGLNFIYVEAYNKDELIFDITVKADGETMLQHRTAFTATKDDYTAFIMAMSIAREYAVEQLHSEMKKEAGEEKPVIIEFKNES